MAAGFDSPKATVHVGDGFKFLEEYKNEFDVIITDSSDPEGPAEALFQKAYFELLFGALKVPFPTSTTSLLYTGIGAGSDLRCVILGGWCDYYPRLSVSPSVTPFLLQLYVL